MSTSQYLRGREEWLERYGSYIKQRRNWQVATFLTLCITILSISGNVIQATQYKVVPYVIEVDQLGKAVGVQRATEATTIPKRVIQAEIANCIVNWRTVTADLSLQERMIKKLSAFVTGSAKGTIRGWYQANSPYVRGRDILVDVKLKGIPLPVSNESWRIEWEETIRNHAGVALESSLYEATVSIRITPATTDASIMQNPAGLHITALSWSKLLGS
ncbi:type IV secretion system protein [Halodesulfovibrio sp.]|jgi:type IV secretion system protein VirB5|uniref:type IV secretion system protein n=1 Tax=Halodesulfovibrio sp. TaxID=1912772 RepID=UPI0025EA77D7|nr:type IV secretion system protein [Halodesulfovibrio sp.]MCT4625654.1 type IV secretion system protein [Halodesulfovibrio sp.]